MEEIIFLLDSSNASIHISPFTLNLIALSSQNQSIKCNPLKALLKNPDTSTGLTKYPKNLCKFPHNMLFPPKQRTLNVYACKNAKDFFNEARHTPGTQISLGFDERKLIRNRKIIYRRLSQRRQAG